MFSIRPFIENWEDKSLYPKDPLQPYTHLESMHHRLQWQNLRYMQWRWELLRRHPQYRDGWKEASLSEVVSNKLYGLATKASNPYEVPPSPVIFTSTPGTASIRCEVNPYLPIPFQLKLIVENANRIKKQLDSQHIEAGLSPPSTIKSRIKSDFRRHLQTLDALISGASIKEIGKHLGGGAGNFRPSQYGQDLIRQALNTQHVMTGLFLQKVN